MRTLPATPEMSRMGTLTSWSWPSLPLAIGLSRPFCSMRPDANAARLLAAGLSRKEGVLMAKAVWMVFTNCPVDREREFNDWYENMHLPDLLTVDGIVAAQRFRLPDNGPAMVTPTGTPAVARYLALYGLDTEDVATVRAAVHALHVRDGGRGVEPS